MSKRKKTGTRKNARIAFLTFAALLFGGLYFANNAFFADENANKTYSETFEEVKVSPDSFKIKIIDESGSALRSDVLGKLSITSLLTAKDCGNKGSTASHPKGGCFEAKGGETSVSITADGTTTLPNKLIKFNQTVTKNKKSYSGVYYSTVAGSGASYIVWTTNTLFVRAKGSGKELAKITIDSPVKLRRNVDKAKASLVDFNNKMIEIKVPSSTLSAILGKEFASVSGNAPILNTETIDSGYYAVRVLRGDRPVFGHNYKVYDWYYECNILDGKEKNCVSAKKSRGELGVTGADGMIRFRTELISVENNYFIGKALGNNRFRIWSKSEIVLIDNNGKRVGKKPINSPFRKPVLSKIFFRKASDSAKLSKNSEKMLSNYKKFLDEENLIKLKEL